MFAILWMVRGVYVWVLSLTICVLIHGFLSDNSWSQWYWNCSTFWWGCVGKCCIWGSFWEVGEDDVQNHSFVSWGFIWWVAKAARLEHCPRASCSSYIYSFCSFVSIAHGMSYCLLDGVPFLLLQSYDMRRACCGFCHI